MDVRTLGGGILSFENTKRLMKAKEQINSFIEQSVVDGIWPSAEEANRAFNKALYEEADKLGVSLWDYCFRVRPAVRIKPVSWPISSYSFNQIKETTDYEIVLEPLELEFEKGSGYWKGKYYALKRKMRELIDDKEV